MCLSVTWKTHADGQQISQTDVQNEEVEFFYLRRKLVMEGGSWSKVGRSRHHKAGGTLK